MSETHGSTVPLDVILESEEDEIEGTLTLGSLLGSQAFRQTTARLPVPLGVDRAGELVLLDLDDAPHLLIGGTTGAGKSNAVHGLLTSLLHVRAPSQLGLVLIDTKRIEFAGYEGVPHLMCPVTRDVDEAACTVDRLMLECTMRASLFAKNYVRNLREYNDRMASLARMGGIEYSDGGDKSLPRIVVVIDDLVELIAMRPRVEAPLSHIALEGRALGIRLVCVSQLPSATTLGGEVKMLFPARLVFHLPAASDSRAVLGRAGAESLSEQGAFLLATGHAPDVVRGRAPLVGEETLNAVARWFEEHHLVHRRWNVQADLAAASPSLQGDVVEEALDPEIGAAAELCVTNGAGSTSLLQRRLGMGYGRAARVIDQLSYLGVLEPSHALTGRAVLVTIADLQRMGLLPEPQAAGMVGVVTSPRPVSLLREARVSHTPPKATREENSPAVVDSLSWKVIAAIALGGLILGFLSVLAH